MRLTLEEIQECFKILVTMLRDQQLVETDTGEHDLYWSILGGDWLAFSAEPTPAVGSLDDDFKELKRLASGATTPSSVDLDRLAAVLRFISEEISSQ